jgi:hypothetical protein
MEAMEVASMGGGDGEIKVLVEGVIPRNREGAH